MDVDNIAQEVEVAFSQARRRALETRQTILEYSEGYLVRVHADGRVEKITPVERSVKVTTRVRRLYAA